MSWVEVLNNKFSPLILTIITHLYDVLFVLFVLFVIKLLDVVNNRVIDLIILNELCNTTLYIIFIRILSALGFFW